MGAELTVVELTLLICMMRLQEREKDQFVFEDLLQEYHFLVSGNRKSVSSLASELFPLKDLLWGTIYLFGFVCSA